MNFIDETLKQCSCNDISIEYKDKEEQMFTAIFKEAFLSNINDNSLKNGDQQTYQEKNDNSLNKNDSLMKKIKLINK